MSLHESAIALLAGWPAPDAHQEDLRRRFLGHVEQHGDRALSRRCGEAHLTASALVLSADRRTTLLTLHPKVGAWIQLGGHCEDDPDLPSAALREATEESGIPDLVLDPLPVHLDAHRVCCLPGGGISWHYDVRFVAVAPPGAAHMRSDESLDLAWWPVDGLPDPRAEMTELVAAAVAR